MNKFHGIFPFRFHLSTSVSRSRVKRHVWHICGFFSITLVYLCKYTAPVVESDRYGRISEQQCRSDNIQWYGEFNSSSVIKQNMLLIAGRYPGFQTKSDPPVQDVTRAFYRRSPLWSCAVISFGTPAMEARMTLSILITFYTEILTSRAGWLAE